MNSLVREESRFGTREVALDTYKSGHAQYSQWTLFVPFRNG